VRSIFSWAFHVVLLISALLVGGVSLWNSGFWMEGRDKVPNFTAMAMVLMVISQGISLWTELKNRNK
jgi:predicted ABC-type exoprotein transport system permease subunit